MQVDLFSNGTLNSKWSSVTGQIETRKFELDMPEFNKFLSLEGNKDSFYEYKERIIELSKQGRDYFRIGSSACDNLFDIEALGIGRYHKKFTSIINFSDRLDYVLHRTCNCSMDNIRKMERYKEISNAMLNFNMESLDNVKLSDLLGLDINLDNHIDMLFDRAEKRSGTSDLLNAFCSSFYIDLISTLSSIKDYTILSIRDQLEKGTFVDRSKTFSSVLASSDEKIDETIIIRQSKFDDCAIELTSYATLQYALKEGAIL